MAVNIYVCMKPVPDPEHYDKVTIDPKTKRITRDGIPTIINPADKCAIEKALRLKEKLGGKVVIVTMSMPSAESNVREALAMGADEGILLTDPKFGGADTLATSYTLAEAIKQAKDYDLVMTGAESADGSTAQVCAQLAAWLKVDHLWNVTDVDTDDGSKYMIKTSLDNGYLEWEAATPLVLGIVRTAIKPRYVSAMGIIKAKSKQIMKWTRQDLEDADDKYLGFAGSPTQPGQIMAPDLKRNGIKLEGTREEIATEVISKLRAAGIKL